MGLEGKKSPYFVEKDVYAVLGVPPESSQEVLTARYKELVKALHPDQSENRIGDPARLQEVTEAYQRIRTPDARRLYDLITKRFPKNPAQGRPITENQAGKIFDRSDPRYELQERLSGKYPI